MAEVLRDAVLALVVGVAAAYTVGMLDMWWGHRTMRRPRPEWERAKAERRGPWEV